MDGEPAAKAKQANLYQSSSAGNRIGRADDTPPLTKCEAAPLPGVESHHGQLLSLLAAKASDGTRRGCCEPPALSTRTLSIAAPRSMDCFNSPLSRLPRPVRTMSCRSR